MASVKKSAIQSRQGHPTGIIDDTAKAFGRAVKRGIRKTETKVYNKVEKTMLNRQVRKEIPRKLVPNKGDRAFYRAERAREINELGGPFAYVPPSKPTRVRAIDTLNANRARKGLKPAVRKYPSKGDASGRMSQQKPNLRDKMIKPAKPAKPGAKSGATKKPAKYVGPEPRRARPAAGGTPKSKKMVPAVKPKRKGVK